MGTRFYALFPNLEEGKAERLFYHLKSEVNRIERKLSRFYPESDVSKLNMAPFGEPVEPDSELFELLEGCKYMWEKTQGAFDITCRPLLEFWKRDGASEGEEFLNACSRCGFEHLLLHNETGSVTMTTEGLELDFGGVGKGYALEKIKELLLHSGVEQAFISFGESSILALGDHPAGGNWKIGMNNYLEPGASLYEFRIHDGSVSTSSNFYLNDSGILINHGHIIDQVSKKPHLKLSSVSVSADSPLLSEMLSTAFLIMDDELVSLILAEYDEVKVVRADYEEGMTKIRKF